jgi:hypothetical protein
VTCNNADLFSIASSEKGGRVKLEIESSNCYRERNFTWQSVFGFRKRQVLLQRIRLSVAKACGKWALPTNYFRSELRASFLTRKRVHILYQAGC